VLETVEAERSGPKIEAHVISQGILLLTAKACRPSVGPLVREGGISCCVGDVISVGTSYTIKFAAKG
jgi:hypothetical protein